MPSQDIFHTYLANAVSARLRSIDLTVLETDPTSFPDYKLVHFLRDERIIDDAAIERGLLGAVERHATLGYTQIMRGTPLEEIIHPQSLAYALRHGGVGVHKERLIEYVDVALFVEDNYRPSLVSDLRKRFLFPEHEVHVRPI